MSFQRDNLIYYQRDYYLPPLLFLSIYTQLVKVLRYYHKAIILHCIRPDGQHKGSYHNENILSSCEDPKMHESDISDHSVSYEWYTLEIIDQIKGPHSSISVVSVVFPYDHLCNGISYFKLLACFKFSC